MSNTCPYLVDVMFLFSLLGGLFFRLGFLSSFMAFSRILRFVLKADNQTIQNFSSEDRDPPLKEASDNFMASMSNSKMYL
jgi:hypothetical protein